MVTMKAKAELQNLINQINSEAELESYLNLIKMLSSNKEGQLLTHLSEDQRNDLNFAYEESLDHSNLLDHEAVKSKYIS